MQRNTGIKEKRMLDGPQARMHMRLHTFIIVNEPCTACTVVEGYLFTGTFEQLKKNRKKAGYPLFYCTNNKDTGTCRYIEMK
jgi:hypothetical protein